MANFQFEDIIPWGQTNGDTGLSSRLKLKRNFDKIKAWADALNLTDYLTKEEAADTYLTRAYFDKLFRLHADGQTPAVTSDTPASQITGNAYSIEAMFGFWTDQYLSAKGLSGVGGSGVTVGIDWSALATYDGEHSIDIRYIDLSGKADKAAMTAGTYTKLTVNSQGVVTAGTRLSASDIPTLDMSKINHLESVLSSMGADISGKLSLTGGTMSNTNLVTNLNADLLDGNHASSFAKVQHANDLMNSSTSNEFTFVSAGYGASYTNGREVYINYHTADGTNGNISQYKFCNGAGGVLASISNGQFSGNAAKATKAGALYNLGISEERYELLFVCVPGYGWFNGSETNAASPAWYSGTGADNYYRAVLIWLCQQYGTTYSGRNVMFVLRCQPNSLNFTILTIYDPSIIDNETGLPQYAFGTAFLLGDSQSLISFGTFDYVYYYNNGKVSHASTASNASALYGFDASMFLRFESATNYLAARMLSPTNAAKAAETYIEWWQDWETGSGWFNHKAGKYIGTGLEISGNGHLLGNFGVGTDNPLAKLDVSGAAKISGDSNGHGIYLNNNKSITLTDTNGAVHRAFFLNNSNLLSMGYGTTKAGGYATEICGNGIIFKTGTGNSVEPTEKVRIDASGRLQIGNCVIQWDSTNQMLKFTGASGQTFNGIYSTGAVSSLGAAALGFSGVIEDAMTFNDTVTLNDAVALNADLTINAAKKVKFGTDANAVTIEKYQNGIKAAGVTLSDGCVSADEIEASSDITTSENINVGLTIVMDDQDDGTRQGVLSVEQGHLWFQYDGGTKVRIA